MTYVITEASVGNKDTACWDACPVEAIYPEDEVPDESYDSIAVNRDFFAAPPT
jgi:formate hydrogenlyase subunit 6/NADH:ubiquinone oxidoreductase subunit I